MAHSFNWTHLPLVCFVLLKPPLPCSWCPFTLPIILSSCPFCVVCSAFLCFWFLNALSHPTCVKVPSVVNLLLSCVCSSPQSCHLGSEGLPLLLYCYSFVCCLLGTCEYVVCGPLLSRVFCPLCKDLDEPCLVPCVVAWPRGILDGSLLQDQMAL